MTIYKSAKTLQCGNVGISAISQTDAPGEYPVVGILNEILLKHASNGRYRNDGTIHHLDLVEVTPFVFAKGQTSWSANGLAFRAEECRPTPEELSK
jgi:hypothetical protein